MKNWFYSEKVKKHFFHPKNALKDEKFKADSVGKVGNVICGDVMEIYLKVEDNVIKDVKFKTFGCVAAISSTDILCQMVKGKKLYDALKIKASDLIKELDDLPANKKHCSLLSLKALKDAIGKYKG